MSDDATAEPGTASDTDSASGDGSDRGAATPDHNESIIPDDERSDDGQVYVDRDTIDFDPEDGLYSGTAVDGSTDIPGPHETADDATDESGDSGSDGSGSDDSDGSDDRPEDDRPEDDRPEGDRPEGDGEPGD